MRDPHTDVIGSAIVEAQGIALKRYDLAEIQKAAFACGHLDLDSANVVRVGCGSIECPICDGDGTVSLEADYCNIDGDAIGIQFYGIGEGHGNAERYYRAVRPGAIIDLIADHAAAIESLHKQLAGERDDNRDLRLINNELENSNIARRFDIHSCNEKIAALTKQLAERDDQLRAANERVSKFQSLVADHEKLAEIAEKRARRQERLHENIVSGLESKLTAAQAELSERERKCDYWRDKAKSQQAELEELRNRTFLDDIAYSAECNNSKALEAELAEARKDLIKERTDAAVCAVATVLGMIANFPIRGGSPDVFNHVARETGITSKEQLKRHGVDKYDLEQIGDMLPNKALAKQEERDE